MKQLGQYLIDHHITIGSVESFTVGGFANMLGSIHGISKVYRASLVTYQSEMKEKLLGIDHDLVSRVGVVSEEVAREMAIKGQEILDCDLVISFTGNSGPLPMEDKPVGLCYMGVAYKNSVQVKTLHLKGSREEIKNQALQEGVLALKILLNIE